MAKKKSSTKKTAKKAGKATTVRKAISRVSAEDLPRRALEDCTAVAKQLYQAFAGQKTEWDDLAAALEIPKSSNSTKYLFWASAAYGLTNREEGNSYTLSELGRKVVAPTYEGEDVEGLRRAVTTPNILSRFYTDYEGHPIPTGDIFANVLERKYGVPRDRLGEASALIVENAEYAGILGAGDDDGLRHIQLQGAPSRGPRNRKEEETEDPQASEHDGDPKAGPAWDEMCFFITPIGDEGSEPRRHADMMLKHVVEPAAEANDLKVIRADKIEKSGVITKQVLEHVLRARMCVADLSFGNPNVFYELGLRHLCLKACPQVIRKGDRIPFDVSQGRTVIVDTGDPYTITDRLQSAKRELSEHIKQALDGGKGPAEDNPVHVYMPGTTVKLPS